MVERLEVKNRKNAAKHGSAWMYVRGCRCVECVDAQLKRSRKYYEARQEKLEWLAKEDPDWLNKQEWLQKHGPCKSCGSNKNLEVDHINRKEKSFGAPAPTNWVWNERLQNELKKCQVLCRKCHIRKSRLEKIEDNPRQHGSGACYQNGCRCPRCISEMSKRRGTRAKNKRLPKFDTFVRDPNIRHGKVGSYAKHGCRCPECREVYLNYSRNWRMKQWLAAELPDWS